MGREKAIQGGWDEVCVERAFSIVARSSPLLRHVRRTQEWWEREVGSGGG
ncbi:MAG: hypothetical protein ACYC6C_11555 [Coriobacteriia bacterium]